MNEFERVGPGWVAVIDQEFLALVGAVDKAVNDFVAECARRWEAPDTSSSFREFALQLVEAWEADIRGVAASLREDAARADARNAHLLDGGPKPH
ncbi:hypothetical protein [Bradyrhizobium sp. HKCCYLRH1043]|uniref:hypothetical protein n=1 Tax=unclassified Bradyrhizobium TaxID=2631580 RepID=UPI003EB70520